MTLHDIIINLKDNPLNRERRNRHDFIMDLIERHHQLSNRQSIKDFIDEYNTCVRYIQIAQKEDESLRGEDYSHGKCLAQCHALSLGYETGYGEFNDKVKEL